MKKEIILKHLIETYLMELNPISSGELKRKCDLPFSPSTIRNYFQKLDGEGMIIKVHISSGRIPSTDAIKKYWIEHLNFDNLKIAEDRLEEVSKKFDVFITIREVKNLVLKSVVDVQNRFILLDFDTKEIVLNYSKELFYLFNEFQNYSLDDIKKSLKMLKLEYLLNKFSIKKIKSFNRNFLYSNYQQLNVDDLLSDEVFDNFQKGLSFNRDFLAYKIDVESNSSQSEMIVLGDVYTNYTKLFNSIKEV